MKEIGKDIFVETEYQGANVGCILTGDGAVLVDTPMIPSEAQHWSRRVARRTKQGRTYLINTDYHISHILGNHFFPAVIIAHELAWQEMAAYDLSFSQSIIDEYKEKDPQVAADLSEVRLVLPEVTLTDSLSLHKGDRLIEVVHFGGHTPATVGVYVPDSRVLFTGDLVVTKRHPSLIHAQSKQWLEALQRIRQMDVEVIVPGHGGIADLSAIEPLANYIEEMRKQVGELYGGGASRREAVEKVRAAVMDLFPVRPEEQKIVAARIRASIERVYEEIRKGE